MLYAVKGVLLGKLGDSRAGIALFTSAIKDLAGHPLADVITPRIGMLLVPGVMELLVTLAEDEPGTARATARARRAAVLAAAHERLRPSVIPPADARDNEAVKARIRALLGSEEYEAAYAEGDGLTTEEAVALMSDVD
jgi:hypothetical protein